MHTFCCILLTLSMGIGAVTGLHSGERVLCTGSDDHVAIEVRHAVCPTVSESISPRTDAVHDEVPASVFGRAKSCVDHELRSGALCRIQPMRWGDAQSVLVLSPMPVPLASASLAPRALVLTGPPGDDPPRGCLGFLRGIILLS